MKILLIDDDDVFNFVHKRIIERIESEVDVVVINSCRNALDYLIACESNLPDLIFLDINMPEMNGFDFLEECLKLPNDISLRMKVIFVTSSLNEADVKKANSYPMVIGFQDKPLNAEGISRLLKKPL
jgi:CheY-like chemotaxis protein